MSDGRYAMGTVLEITLVSDDEDRARRTLDELFEEVDRLEERLSTWRADSDLSRINRTAGQGLVAVHPDVAGLLHRALGWSRLSGGAFDVTVGPLVALWRSAEARGAPPSTAELAQARARVGAQGVRIAPGDRVGLAHPGMSIDLGAVAKGFALDRLLPILRERGIRTGLLNFGQSSVRALGVPPGTDGWRLLARDADGGYLGVFTLRDRALSVSGSLGQSFEILGRSYGHVLDPRTGRPLERRLQAFVVAADAALAEALSTAVLVLGEGPGLELVASQPGCEGMLVDADGGDWQTPGFAAAVSFERMPGRGARTRGETPPAMGRGATPLSFASVADGEAGR